MTKTDERLKKFRSRWMRWLGQKLAFCDGVELLDSNYAGWMHKVLKNHYIWEEKCSDRWRTAISVATESELGNLDCLCIEMKES